MSNPTVALGVEFVGIEHTWLDLTIYLGGWMIGWLLLWRPRLLPTIPSTQPRPTVSVVIPARNEAVSLPDLLRPLVEQRRPGDQIVVVDDHSSDGTSRVARLFDVDVIVAPALPDGWLGKPHACWHGAQATDADVVVFIDADVQPGPSLLDDVAAQVEQQRDHLISMQPWHAMKTVGEQPSILFNVAALMGAGAFGVLPDLAAPLAFGPVLAVDRELYTSVGGHANNTVRSMHTEDIGLAREIGAVSLFVGSRDTTTFRMYPGGFDELVRGWTRSLATGARFTSWWVAVAILLWIWSLAGGWLAAPIVYPLSALQVWVLGRRAGSTHPLAAVLFPLLVVVFVVVFVRSLFVIVFKRETNWKGRGVETRLN